MKKLAFLLIGAVTLLFNGCQQKQPAAADQIAEKFADLKANFVDPHATFRPVPFWVWDGTVTKAFLDFSITDLKNHGFGGVMAHPRYGLTNNYLSEEWFDLIRYTVDKTKELGMDFWIYDENSFPSGFAGGHVPAGMPESYNQGSSLHEVSLNTLKKENLEKYVAIYEINGDNYNNITDKAGEYAGKSGNYLAYEKVTYQKGSAWNAGFSYVDLLVPGVTEYFLKVTIEDGYKPSIGDEFGKTVKGSFTDEPNIAPIGHGNFRWTPDLFDRFRERYGYNLEDNLPSIKNNIGNYKQVRHNYFQMLLQLFVDRWGKPSYEYYEANNLEFTGHYWEHGWPAPHHGGDNMAMYAWHQRPAIDLLFNQMDDDMPTQFGDVRNVKELSSVANQMERRRTLSETYGAAGWDLTFNDMKRLGDWEFVLGVNTMNQHLHLQTLLGSRKHDFPQSFSYHAPYWDQYTVLNDYFGRLSYVLSAGQQVNDIVVFEPTTTAWMYYQSDGEGEGGEVLDKLNRSFRELLNGMEAKQIEYDLACENIVKDQGRVNGKEFIIGKRAYKTVVLPEYSESLDQSTFDLLSQFIKNGGEVIIIDQRPSLIDGKAAEYGEEWSKTTLLSSNATAIAQLKNTIIAFDKINPGDGRFYHMRRELADGQVLFFVNSSNEAKASASLAMKGKSVLLMDAIDGTIKNYPCTKQGGDVSFNLELEPSGSILFFIADNDLTGFEDAVFKNGCEIINPEGAISVVPQKPNVLNIDYVTMIYDGKTYPYRHTSDATDSLFVARGSERGSPWFSAIQYKQTIMDMDKNYTEGSGFKAEYKFTIADNFDYSDIKAVLEQEFSAVTSINGNVVTPIPGEYYLDHAFKVFPVGKYLKKGENALTIEAPRMHILAEIEPAYIIGNFAVLPAQKGFTIKNTKSLMLGSWKQQGYPFYSHGVLYSADYNVANTNASYTVTLNEWNGTVAEITVNGEKAGIIGWAPYSLDVSKFVKEGTNTIGVEVIGSLRNVLGPFHRNRPGIATPWSWRYQPPYGPGSEYNQLDYGLFSPFSFCKQ